MIRQKSIHIVLAITLLTVFVIDIVEAGSKKEEEQQGRRNF